MTHWAAAYIAKPYRAGAAGPDAFDCVGLVRHYFKSRHGIELPDYSLQAGDARDLSRFSRATGWRPCTGAPQPDDVMTMESFDGKHVGIVVRNSEGLGLLHAVGREDRGQVVWQPLGTLWTYKNKQLWRKP
jgi:cell wall-associated NlpC family hydrolase